MSRGLALAIAALLFLVGGVRADEKETEDQRDDAAVQVKENPDNAVAVQTFALLRARQILEVLNSDPAKAEQQLTEFRTLIDSLEPTTDDGKEAVERAKSFVRTIDLRLRLARTTLEQATASLKEKPDDTDTLALYQAKVLSELSSKALYQPQEAQATLRKIQEFLAERQEAVEDEDLKTIYQRLQDNLTATVEKSLERGLALAETLGTAMEPIEADAWVNGDSLTPDDLKGKVVLLDFWAVWCGPCIATFPHLREWQEKYADKGLVIIGLTNYYNYQWNDEAKRASRAQEQLTAEQEQQMLEKFAEHYELKHRFAVQKEGDNRLSEHYKVTGIPHVVLFDRESKVRLYRIGSGEENAKAIQAEIEKLLAE